MEKLVVLAGSSHPELAKAIVNRLGIELGNLHLIEFANTEISVEIGQSVRDADVFIVQTCHGKVNDHLMELLIIIHACKIASAARITVIAPYLPYSRHVLNPADRPLMEPLNERQADMVDKFKAPNTLIDGYKFWAARSGRLVATMIETAGADHLIAVDLHNPQSQGFFSIPVDNLPSQPLLLKHISQTIPDYKNSIIVSPDAGGAKRAADFAHHLELPLALIHYNPQPNSDDEVVLVGDVRGKTAILVDDMVDTGHTLVNAADLLKREGANRVYAAVTHGIFSDSLLNDLLKSPIDKVLVSNSIPLHQSPLQSKLNVFDLSPLLAEVIRRMHHGESVSFLFSPDAFL